MNNNIHNEGNQHEAHLVMMKHNVFINWKSEYNLGIPIIDEQHRGIVSIINSLHFGMQNNFIEEMLTPIIDMMYDYTHIHFQVEETFLQRISFPNAKTHHALHIDLSSKLNDIGRRSMLDKDPYQVMNLLKDWWISHICSEDLKYRDFFLLSAEQ